MDVVPEMAAQWEDGWASVLSNVAPPSRRLSGEMPALLLCFALYAAPFADSFR